MCPVKRRNIFDICNMREIILTGTWGTKTKTVTLTIPKGSTDTVQIYIDKYYHGNFVRQNGRWEVFLNPGSDLCSNDIEVMREAIKKNS